MRRPLHLRTAAQHIVDREDVDRAGRGVVAHTNFIDEEAGASDRGLRMASGARDAIKDRPDLRERFDFLEVRLAGGEGLQIRRTVQNRCQRRSEAG